MDFSTTSVLVLGDVMLDHYIAGTASRVSPEAPVPVVSMEQSWTVPGGAANVARGLARLGCHAKLIGLVGSDPAGESLRKEIAAEGIQGGLVQSRGRPTICKTRIMAHGQQLLRVDEETIQSPTLEEYVSLRLNFAKLLPGCNAVILSDYAKGALLRDKDGKSICQEAIKLAREANIPVLVDPKGIDWGRYQMAQCVTPNSSEFKKVCESLGHTMELSDGAKYRTALAEELCKKFSFERLLLTRGPKGMNLYQPDEKPLRIHATMREVADVSGAGDTVIATLTACVAKGLSWAESARIANIAAGIAVGKMGTAPVNIQELNKAMGGNESDSRLFSLSELLEKIAEWRKNNQKIVFTNGCFDLLHPGHVSIIQQCAQMGDKLVIGLNSDSSVKRLKGHERPVQDEQSRAQVLSSMRGVDAVILFDEDTPENLIKAVRPDYLVKGSDYEIKDIAGSQFVQNYGGQVRLVDIVDGQSTSGIVQKIKAGAE